MLGKVFDIVGGEVTFTAEALALPFFKVIWDRDKTKNKEIATKEISYIIFKNKYDSPYTSYPESERGAIVIKDVFTKKYEPDDLVLEAEKRYNELQDSISLRLLKSSYVAIDAMINYFLSLPTKIIDDKIVRNLTASVKDLAATIKSLDSLEKQVQKEQLEDVRARGGSEIGIFELPRNK